MKTKRILIQCSTTVNRDAVTRRTVDGVEHVVISSATLPDDIVMNGGLYPAEEIAKSFMSLERTLAPVEHPTDSGGMFISANDPIAIHNFYAGAFNENVRRENGRVMVDKVINVAEAMKTDRGKRLLDRVAELEMSDDPRPIHTSVGVFLNVEELDAPQTNTAGDTFTWVARDMDFDHDAILLDSVGAAQPDQGVGMAVNAEGDEIEVQQALVTIDAEPGDEMSHREIRDALDDAIRLPPFNGDWVVDIFEGSVIFEAGENTFTAPYIFDGRIAKIVGLPLPVQREVTFTPKTNQENDAMKELMLKALADAGLSVNADISDVDLLAKYTALQASTDPIDGTQPDDMAAVVANAVEAGNKPLLERIDGLEAKLNATDDAEVQRLADLVGNSDKYPGLDADGAKALPAETLKAMAANCGTAYGIPALTTVNADGSTAEAHTYEMPK